MGCIFRLVLAGRMEWSSTYYLFFLRCEALMSTNKTVNNCQLYHRFLAWSVAIDCFDKATLSCEWHLLLYGVERVRYHTDDEFSTHFMKKGMTNMISYICIVGTTNMHFTPLVFLHKFYSANQNAHFRFCFVWSIWSQPIQKYLTFDQEHFFEVYLVILHLFKVTYLF